MVPDTSKFYVCWLFIITEPLKEQVASNLKRSLTLLFYIALTHYPLLGLSHKYRNLSSI